MIQRGRVLRDTSAGPGLLSVDGKQHSFTLEGTWKSDMPPKAGMVIAVDIATDGTVAAVTAVPESQLAREQADVAMAAAKEKGAALASSLVARFGLPSLAASGVLILGWFVLPMVSIKAFMGSMSFTFWQILGFLNSSRNGLEGLAQGMQGGGSSGLYGALALVAVAGPFIHHFWKDRRAVLAGLLPLLFMLLVFYMIGHAVKSGFDTVESAGVFSDMARRAQEEAMKALSMGSGFYLSLLASLYFGGAAVRKFLVARAGEQRQLFNA